MMMFQDCESMKCGAICVSLGSKYLLTSTSPYKRKVCEEKAFTDFFCADIEKMVLYKTGKSLYN